MLKFHWKDCCQSWSSNTLATWCEELTHWKKPWCWERLKAGGDRGWDLVGITNSMDMSLSKLGSWWWTGRPGVLQSTGLQSWTRLNWTETRCSGRSHNIPGLPDKSVYKDTLWPQTVLPCIFKAFLFYFLCSFCPASTKYRKGTGTSYPVPFLHTTSQSILNVCRLSKLNI